MKSVDKLRHLAKEMGWASVAELADEIEQEAGGQNITGNGELLPCPFCGGEAEVCEGGINGKMRVYGLVEHKDGCFFLADGLPTKYQHIMENDFDAWNTRAERTCKNNAPVYLDFLCSECGFVHYHSEANDTGEGNEWNYCPNCGAKVVGA